MFPLKCEYCGFEQTIKKRIEEYTYYELTHCIYLWCPCNSFWFAVIKEEPYENINKTQKVKKLEKRKRRLQRSIARKYEKNKKGESYCKTKNIKKEEKELLKLHHQLTNLRQNASINLRNYGNRIA